MKKVNGIVVGVASLGVIVLVITYILAGIFNWNANFPSPKTLLDIGACVVALGWLLFILKVPWDLYFTTNNVLFEMQRSRERQIAVNEDRARYVQRMRKITMAIAIGAHLGSAAIITGLTYWSHNQIGYYFAFFYLLTTFFRPALQAYGYLLMKLREIRGEITVPREDAHQLRYDLAATIAHVTGLQERLLKDESRLTANEEVDRNLRAEILNLQSALARSEKLNENRIQMLTSEIERTMTKAFDQQDIVTGLRAFAKLVKQA